MTSTWRWNTTAAASASTSIGAVRGDGIAGISKGDCRLFLTSAAFRAHYGNGGPVVIWLNLDSRKRSMRCTSYGAGIRRRSVAAPESKPWGLH